MSKEEDSKNESNTLNNNSSNNNSEIGGNIQFPSSTLGTPTKTVLTNSNGGLRTLNRASSLQNLSSQSPGGFIGVRNKSDLNSNHQLHHHHHNPELNVSIDLEINHSNTLKVEDKLDLIKYDAANTNHPTPSSKYDFVKVKVSLENHYYVLSRFLISRVLNVTKVDAADSVKISLELKKTLVDQGRLTITQAELENELFKLLQQHGYGKEYIERYRMTTQFHHQRVPLIILISGPKCIGKSWLATQLAERLNLSTVLQTTLVHDLMHNIIKEFQSDQQQSGGSNMFGMPSDPPIVFKNFKNKEELIQEFKKECAMIRHGVDTDVEKCFEEGKAIIIEGPHIDPFLFTELIAERNMVSPIIFDEKHKSFEDLTKLESLSISNINSNNNNNIVTNNNNSNVNNNSKNNVEIIQSNIPIEIPPTSKPISTTPPLVSTSTTTSAVGSGSVTSSPQQLSTSVEKTTLLNLKKPKTKGIIIPFVLSMKEDDHRLLIQNQLSISPMDRENARKAFGEDPVNQTEHILNNLQNIQEYLLTGIPPFQKVEVNAHSLLETLDVLHSAVLKRINSAYSGHVKGFEYE
ncbi:hypothetical protein DLAC_00072 [Tieghemostelium lacteum]|uniref:Uncharacterized protein n=1 Tax=Tieghemostelium lacteum TaxID=361077 RepID=A0A152A8T6_TIELA|nr:hypothetical protein DLAC_00072 [Tieghemostelium lacteum]|eukprot:KYR02624.1 hypothetical protein DLAC_00072 [Tieghemostelium lacteum]